MPNNGEVYNLVIDKLQTLEEAGRLAVQDWEGLGICLIATVPPLIAQEMKRLAPDRVTTLIVGDFTRDEMARYLAGSSLQRWQTIPADIRDTLRRPLLAKLYREISTEAEYSPPNEYELYAHWWDDVRRGREVTATMLLQLALTVLHDSPYPWTPEQLVTAGIDQDAADDLLQRGGLQRTADGRFVVWHDRLLNWVVAEALVGATVAGKVTEDVLCAETRRLFVMPLALDRLLGYVPMDVVWQLVTRHPDRMDLIDAMLDALTAGDWRTHRVLFQDLLPTVGPRVADAIMRYALRHSGSPHGFGTNEIINGLLRFSAEDLAVGARALLGRTEPETIRLATSLLAARPHPDNLDALWRLRCDLRTAPELYADEARQEQAWWLERDCMRAMRASVKLDPNWLERQIQDADPSLVPVHDLAYLLAGLDGERDRWLRCKPILIQKLPPEKIRAIALNIFTHCDEAEQEWVRSRVSSVDDSLGEYALRALTRLDSKAAVDALLDLPGPSLFMTRNWCLRGLLLRQPEAAGLKLWERRDHDAANVVRAFQGQEDYLPAILLEWLLDQTEILLSEGETLENAHLLLDLLAGVNRFDLLRCFENRQGMPLERRLADLLAQSPRPYVSQEPPLVSQHWLSSARSAGRV